MSYAISIIMTVTTGTLVFLVQSLLRTVKKMKDEKKEKDDTWQKAISAGVVALLRIQLIEYHDKYMVGEHIPTYVYDNFNEMYKAYKALGGNGLIEHMKADIDRLRLTNKGGANGQTE